MFEKNPDLRGANEKIAMTQDQINEYIKCREDILHFAENYYYIQTIDYGRIKIPLWDFQKKMLKILIDPSPKRHVIVLSARQMSKTTVSALYLLHSMLFSKDCNIAILANNERTSREILSRIQMAYINLPLWLQKGIVEWNKGSMLLENGVKIIAASTSSNSIRGCTISTLFIDEASFVPQHIWDDFYMSVYPTVSSGKNSKIIMVSTPNGMNHFYDMYRAAVKGENSFKPIKVAWNERPDRDEQWAEDMKRDVGAKRFAQEFQCKFLGASNTLVDGDVLEKIDTKIPIDQKYSFAMPIYEKPIEGSFYIMGVDSAKGNEADYSVIQVLKIKGKYDLEQVAMYRSNTTNIDAFVQICIGVSEYYNDAYMMVENNDVGALVAEKLWYDWECDRIINVDKKGLGIRATKKTKFEGNMLLQRYVEEGWIKINDERTVYELSRYEETSPNVYHAAGQNENDDCVTALLWALYFIITPFYDSEESGVMVKKRKENMDDEMPTFLSDGDDHNDWSFLHNMK
jgi:hypothetical protein